MVNRAVLSCWAGIGFSTAFENRSIFTTAKAIKLGSNVTQQDEAIRFSRFFLSILGTRWNELAKIAISNGKCVRRAG